jgi:hypothetical protein
MKRVLLLLLTTVVGTSLALGQTLSDADRDRGVKHLEATREALRQATSGLSQAQWTFKPAQDRWSVAECVEHIALSEDALFKLVTEQVMKSPAKSRESAEAKEVDTMVLTAIADRSKKFQAPQEVAPSGRLGSPEEALQHFLGSRAKTLNFLETTPDLRAHALDSPLGQKLDAYEWILYISAHSDRHTKQLNEVKADLNFPKE